MATKVTIIGESPKKTKNKIQFLYFLNESGEIKEITKYHISSKPDCFENVELFARNYCDKDKNKNLDLIFCYDKNRNCRDQSTLVLGYFNSGEI